MKTVEELQEMFPESDGWIIAAMTLIADKQWREEEIVQAVSNGRPNDFDFAYIKQEGKELKVVYRPHPGKLSAALAVSHLVTRATEVWSQEGGAA